MPSSPFAAEAAQTIKEAPLFHGLDDQIVAQLVASARVRRFPRNNLVFQEGDPSTSLLVVLRGRIRVFLPGDDDPDVELAVLTRSAVVGELGLLDGDPRSASVMTLDDCAFLEIDRATLLQAIQHSPAVALTMMRHLAGVIRRANHSMRTRSLRGMQARLLRCLEALAGDGEAAHAEYIEIGKLPPRRQLADQMGCTRETVSRLLGDLRESGDLVESPGSVRVRSRRSGRWLVP